MLRDYQQLLQLWARQPYDHTTEELDFRRLPSFPAAWVKVSSLSPCITWVFNLRTLRYDYVSENATERLGMTPRQLMKEGISLYKEAIHPADDLMLWDLTRKAWELLLATPAPKRFACGYNRAYRLRKAGGTYRWLLEHNQVLQADRRGNITHLLGTCTDITPIREDSPVRVSLVHEQSGMLVDMAIEQQEREKSLFSKRELEILAMVVAGQTSSQIASHLHLSYHTVNKHRSKMHRKIRSRSTAELVQFAMRHRLVTIQ